MMLGLDRVWFAWHALTRHRGRAVLLVLAITYSGWVPGTEAIVSDGHVTVGWVIVLVFGGTAGLLVSCAGSSLKKSAE